MIRQPNHPRPRCALLRRMPPQNGGLTLIEIAVVLVILSVLALVATPNMRDFITRHRIKSTAENMRAALSFAKIEAIRRNRTIQFCIHTSTQQWQVQTTSGEVIRVGSWSPSITVNPDITRTITTSPGNLSQRCVEFRSNSLPNPPPTLNSNNENPILSITSGQHQCLIDLQNTLTRVIPNNCP